ncbi:MAG: HAD family hydrolase [Verrucomicrobiaceae bacterium]|nr:MAG: HAD family hydrolase [Verrucomicrobiaceae bacterium]
MRWRTWVFGVECGTVPVQPPRRMDILFDLDGTLVDSRAGIFNCIRYSMEHHQLPVPTAEDLLWCIGPPILESFAKLVGPDSPHLFEPAVVKYREQYSAIGIFECEVFPEILETLEELQRQGHTMHVATSKAEVYAKRIITHFEMDRFFASVNGSELDGTRANKAELIAHILEQQRISRDEVVMIGDREHDIIGAVKNGVPSIGAMWGYGTGKELVESGATLCARVPRLLVELVGSL